MRTRTRMVLPALAVAAALAFTAGAGADQDRNPTATPKSERTWPEVKKDIDAGKAKKLKAVKTTYGVWNGCRFEYLRTDDTTWEFSDGSVATVADNPEPLPPRNCSERNPTVEEYADMEKRVEAANAPNRDPRAGPPPSLPLDRFKGGPMPVR